MMIINGASYRIIGIFPTIMEILHHEILTWKPQTLGKNGTVLRAARMNSVSEDYKTKSRFDDRSFQSSRPCRMKH
jgi:hypothetical protein